MSSLLWSFVHNVVVHPMLFVRDVATRAGLHRVSAAISTLHDENEIVGGLKPGFQDYDDDGADVGAPPQSPWTDEARAMVYRPVPPPPPEPEPEPLAGSVAARLKRAREIH